MRPERRQLAGILLISTSALMLEVILTRIFSVTMWYHFAFLAISMALMGSAVAGIALYFLPRLADPRQAKRWIGLAALALALATPITFLIYLRIPLQLSWGRGAFSFKQLLGLIVVYLDLTVPFFLSGLALSLALATWPKHTGQVYWADLMGAAMGCLLSIAALEALGGAGALLSTCLVAACAGLVFTWRRGRWQMASALAIIILLSVAVWGAATHKWLTITVNKTGGAEPPRIYEEWNAHSRVTVYETSYYPFYWSVDQRYWDKVIQEKRYLNHALLLIDAVAGTPVQEFRGLLHEEEFLRYDLTSFAYHLIDQPNTLVIGPGGGRDVLAALASGAPHVTAVEVNSLVVDAVRGPLAEFSGHLYERPDVTIVVDDARGYITRSPERYDLIQASLIDTWAAGGSGAFALSENSLYTIEAFKTYYEHLSDRGILTISRWYLTERPAETMRLVSTAMAGWKSAGVADPRPHVAVVARPNASGQAEGMATALFKRAPFTQAEIELLQAKAAELGFTVLYAPSLPTHEEVGQFIEATDPLAVIAAYPLDISPATDDRPFFFNLVRLGNLFNPALSASGVYRTSMEAMTILVVVMGIMALAGILFVLLPLEIGARRRGLPRASARLLGYFAALGLAFMLVEIPTIQRITVFLGRPVYSLAVVLFSLLLFSSLGSLWSSRQPITDKKLTGWFFAVLVLVVVLHALAGDWLVRATIGQSLELRLGLAMLRLAPLGFMMGMPFPLGMRWAGSHQPGVIPWLWGINGVMSVMGSALAMALAIHVGFQITLVIAAVIYGAAGALLAIDVRQAAIQKT